MTDKDKGSINKIALAIKNIEDDRKRSLDLYEKLLEMHEMTSIEAEIILDAEADIKEGWRILQAKRAVYSNLLTATVQLLRSLADASYKMGQLAKSKWELDQEHQELERLRMLEGENGEGISKEDIDRELSEISIDVSEEAALLEESKQKENENE